jgi:hypothetical protein
MAGNWIKFDTSTSDKPEVWAIAESLGIDPDAVVGKLLRVWAWFDDQTEKGNAPIVTRALLDRKVGVTGFVTAMVSAGWMVETDGLLTLPNFDRHNGQTAKNRVLTAKRVATHKKGNAEGNAKGNATIVTRALPKEEKNREEKNTHTHTAEPEPIQPEDELAPHWRRWCEYCLAIGKPVNEIQADAILMDLGRRGTAKAIRDIDFSIRKSAKSILDSDNDFEKQATKPRTFTPATKTRNYQ